MTLAQLGYTLSADHDGMWLRDPNRPQDKRVTLKEADTRGNRSIMASIGYKSTDGVHWSLPINGRAVDAMTFINANADGKPNAAQWAAMLSKIPDRAAVIIGPPPAH